jgi:hypothetical protein
MFDPAQMKDRNSSVFRDWIYDILHVLCQTPLMFSRWQKKDGSAGAYRMNLLKKFSMWGKDKDAKWGEISITIDSETADGLRERNTAPILLTVENSIRGDNAFALYRYLRQVLFKAPIFKIGIFDLHERLGIGSTRKDHLINDLRDACKEIQGLEIPNGRIASCEVVQDGKPYYVVAKRGAAARRMVVDISSPAAQQKAEEQRMIDARVGEAAMLRQFETLPPDEKAVCQIQVDRIMAERVTSGLGVETHRKLAICDVMANYYLEKGGQKLASLNEPLQMVREEGTVLYQLDETQKPSVVVEPANVVEIQSNTVEIAVVVGDGSGIDVIKNDQELEHIKTPI